MSGQNFLIRIFVFGSFQEQSGKSVSAKIKDGVYIKVIERQGFFSLQKNMKNIFQERTKRRYKKLFDEFPMFGIQKAGNKIVIFKDEINKHMNTALVVSDITALI